MSHALDWTHTLVRALVTSRVSWQSRWMLTHIHAKNATEQLLFFLLSEIDHYFSL